MPPEDARPLYEHFARALALLGPRVETGVFGARMDVALVNAGPATFWIELANSASATSPDRG
jgi:D-aminoacyl-tRNA deacylase